MGREGGEIGEKQSVFALVRFYIVYFGDGVNV